MSTLVTNLYHLLLLLYYIFIQTAESPYLPIIFIWYAFCCRTPINIVNSFNGWTIKHVLVAMKQHQLCGKGSQGWQLRLRLQKMRGTMPMHWKQKHGSRKGQQSARQKNLGSHSRLLNINFTSIGWLYLCLGLQLGCIFFFPLYLGAMDTRNCACCDFNFCHVSYV